MHDEPTPSRPDGPAAPAPRRATRRVAVGIGARDCGDDALGPEVCDRIRRLDSTVDVWIVEADATTVAMLWRPDDRVVVIDAVTTGAAPGTVTQFDPALLAASAAAQGIRIADALRLSDVRGTRPRELWVLGVEAAAVVPGTRLSPAVAGTVDDTAARVLELLGPR